LLVLGIFGFEFTDLAVSGDWKGCLVPKLHKSWKQLHVLLMPLPKQPKPLKNPTTKQERRKVVLQKLARL
jgi:hypothetical protein